MAAVPVTSVVPTVSYTVGATPSTGPFAFTFPVLKAADLKVYINTGAGEVLKTYGTDYTISGLGVAAGGSITLTSSTSNSTVRITRALVIEFTETFPTTGPFDPAAINNQLSRIHMMLQQVDNGISQAALGVVESGFDPGDYPALSYTWPTPVAGKLLAWNGAASALTNVDVPTPTLDGADFTEQVTIVPSTSVAGLDADRALQITGNLSGACAENEASFIRFNIDSDDVDMSGSLTGGKKVNGLGVFHKAGGANAWGGRHAIGANLQFNTASDPTNPDRHYVAVVGNGIAETDDGGTSGAKLGAMFGGNFVANMQAGATNWSNATAAEFNVFTTLGSSVDYITGIQIVGDKKTSATGIEGMIALSNISGSTGWTNGIMFTGRNGQQPVQGDGCNLILVEATHGVPTVEFGINFAAATFSLSGNKDFGYAFISPGFKVNGWGNAIIGCDLAQPNAYMTIGARNKSTGSSFIDMRAASNATSYDVRILCQNPAPGSALTDDGTGVLEIYGSMLHFIPDGTTPSGIRVGTTGSNNPPQGGVMADNLFLMNLPTSASGLAVGAVWCDTAASNVLKLVL